MSWRDEFPHVAASITYAERVTAGRILTGVNTRLVCERYLNDLNRDDWGFYFNPKEAERRMRFLGKLKHVKGVWNKQCFQPEPWQSLVFVNLFGWFRIKDDLRRFIRAAIYLPRKNGKSFMGAGLGLMFFCYEKEAGAEVYVGARTEEQAHNIFKPARLMCMRQPELVDHYDITIWKKKLEIESNGSLFEPVSGNPGDGPSPSLGMVDEYHEHKTSRTVDAFTTGQLARENPLLAIFSTSGILIGGPCHEDYRDCEKILTGEYENDRTFVFIAEADEDDDWDSDEAYIKANPNLGVSVFEHKLEAERDGARVSATKRVAYETKHLNRWVGSAEAWLNMLEWQRVKQTGMTIEDFDGHECYAAIDLSSKSDATAIAYMFYHESKYYLFTRVFIPSAALKVNADYRRFHASGAVTKTPGSGIDYDEVKKELLEQHARTPIKILGFDEWQSLHLVQQIEKESDESIQTRSIPQRISTMNEPMNTFQLFVGQQKLLHDGCPALTWFVGNTYAATNQHGFIYPVKESKNSLRKIDAAVASIMTLALWMDDDNFESDSIMSGYYA